MPHACGLTYSATCSTTCNVADVLTEAMKQSVVKITETISNLLLETVDGIKADMKVHVDKAIASAKGGLDKLKVTITEIPPKIKTAVDSLCQLLPATGDLQAVCSTNVQGVVKNATAVAGVICQKGVNAMVIIADKALATASEAAGAQIVKIGGACTSAASALPLEEAKTAIGDACTNVTEKLASLPKELLANSTKEVNVSLSGVCMAIASLRTNHAVTSFEQLHIDSVGMEARLQGSLPDFAHGVMTDPVPDDRTDSPGTASPLHKSLRAILPDAAQDAYFGGVGRRLLLVERHVELQQTSVLRLSALLEESTVQTAVTDALSKSVEIFKGAAKKAALKVIPVLAAAINKTMAFLKSELQVQADKAAEFASQGLEKLKTALAGIPPKVQAFAEKICTPLPTTEMKSSCNSGVAGIVANATGVISDICKSAVPEMMVFYFRFKSKRLFDRA